MNEKELRRKLKELRKIKNDSRKGSALRHSLNRQIRGLKKQLAEQTKCSPEKTRLVKLLTEIQYKKYMAIKKKYPKFDVTRFINRLNIKKFTVEQLQLHYNRILAGKTKI